MDADKKLALGEKIELLWDLSRPYRAGFALGFLAVSLTLALILTGQKSEKLSFKAEPRQKPQTAESTLSSGPVAEFLGASTSAAVKKKTVPAKIPSPVSNQSKKININTANTGLLESLPYIGPVMAARIIDYRTNHGPFKSIDALDNVKGIGPKTIEKFRSLVTVE